MRSPLSQADVERIMSLSHNSEKVWCEWEELFVLVDECTVFGGMIG